MKTVDRLVVKSVVVMLGVVLGIAGCVPNGRSRAVRPYGVPAPLQLQTAVAVDKDGNQVLVGSFAGHLEVAGTELVSAGGTDIFVTKTDKAGAPLFAPLRFGGPGSDSATGVALDEGGVIIVAGTFQEQATFGTSSLRAEVRAREQLAVFVARLGAKGEVQWVKQVGVVSVPTQVSVAVAPDHSIIVGASSSGVVERSAGPATLLGESITLTHLGAGGEPIGGGHPLSLFSLPVGCEHSLCQLDWYLPPVTAGCGMYGCTAAICAWFRDPYCCANYWDPICVGEMLSICRRACDCSNLCLQDSPPPYPDACDGARTIINALPDCGNNWTLACVQKAQTLNLCH